MNAAAPLQGLPVSGYRPQPAGAVAAVNAMKRVEEQVLRLLDQLKDDADLRADPRWLATGRTQIEIGFMAVNRSIFKPGRTEIEPDALPESGWVLERVDSDPDAPLFYAPAGHHGDQWSADSEAALRFSREIDAAALANALCIQCRVVECLWDAS